jgi:hypothetical protein
MVPRALLANVGTPFDVDSLHFRLQDGGWKTYRQPYQNARGELIWPRMEGKIREWKAIMKPAQVAIALELDPQKAHPGTLSVPQIQGKVEIPGSTLYPRYQTQRLQQPERVTLGERHVELREALQPQVNCFVVLDPASGSKLRRADYCGLAVVALAWAAADLLPELEVLEAHAVHDEAIPQVEQAAALARRYACPVLVEVNAMQRIFRELFKRVAPDVWVIPHLTDEQSKWHPQMGLTVLKTLVLRDRLKLVGPRTEGMTALAQELRDLGTGSKDHLCMACWFAVRYMYDRHRHLLARQRLSRQTGQRLPEYRPLMGRTVIDLRKWRQKKLDRMESAASERR